MLALVPCERRFPRSSPSVSAYNNRNRLNSKKVINKAENRAICAFFRPACVSCAVAGYCSAPNAPAVAAGALAVLPASCSHEGH